MLKKQYYSWPAYERDVCKLAKEIKSKKLSFKNIYGLPRGGLVLAVSLSHLLNKPLVFKQSEVTKVTLLVDDIIETGQTFKKLISKLRLLKPLIAALYYNKKSKVIPAVFARAQTKWVVFPWETTASSRYDKTI